jgi:hypothetical protein
MTKRLKHGGEMLRLKQNATRAEGPTRRAPILNFEEVGEDSDGGYISAVFTAALAGRAPHLLLKRCGYGRRFF